MYLVSDRKAAIREIQRYLLELSNSQIGIPHVSIDGIYGDATKEAVIRFQQLNGLDPTGKVNYETFTLLYSQYVVARDLRTESTDLVNINSFPFSIGDSGDEVAILNSLLNALSKYYPEMGRITNRNYYSRRTASAVSYMQKIFGYEETGITSAGLFNRLSNELNSRNTITNSKYL